MGSSSNDFEGRFEDMLPECVGGPSIFGENWIMPARIAGMQAQKMAVLVSNVDQNVVGILSHVGSAVSPNVLRLSRRIIEVMQTLKLEMCYQRKTRRNGMTGWTNKLPTPNMAYIPIFFLPLS
jgi:hypothetical protein